MDGDFMNKNIVYAYALIATFAFIGHCFAGHDHDVVIGLDTASAPYQLTLSNHHELETFELAYNDSLGLYYGGQVCWVPEEQPC